MCFRSLGWMIYNHCHTTSVHDPMFREVKTCFSIQYLKFESYLTWNSKPGIQVRGWVVCCPGKCPLFEEVSCNEQQMLPFVWGKWHNCFILALFMTVHDITAPMVLPPPPPAQALGRGKCVLHNQISANATCLPATVSRLFDVIWKWFYLVAICSSTIKLCWSYACMIPTPVHCERPVALLYLLSSDAGRIFI